jgi:hypothetical protein
MSSKADTAVYESLPGIDVPVGEVNRRLAELWETNAPQAQGAPSAFRATQMNLLLHLGLSTTVEDAQQVFSTALCFAQRHPSRIVVLCPVDMPEADVRLRARIFAECYVGASGREMSCCEAVVLSYARESRAFLESQVSTLIESDLPLVYWPHAFELGSRIRHYLFFAEGAQRVVVDSSTDNQDLVRAAWPKPDAVRDLASCRLLPVRQALGQFLSGFEPARLAAGLRTVHIRAPATLQAEARALLEWTRVRLAACGATISQAPDYRVETAEGADVLDVTWERHDGRALAWSADFAQARFTAEADFGTGHVQASGPVRLLAPDAALAEAVFF